ncbi:MAG: hypothetical protein KGJ23_03110 [Euryarchaeota archaeon]|nr:hypothetical protein [Euryarchaeota archaeon]MDE1835587.1 hypothetical protein [Euryarchaeota archaeon]MDE1878935.1 hypothetical protein [Euryarchaeota archaeon]MDE2043791.1 hypothetical protein [Thermoplasmata archaeon]
MSGNPSEEGPEPPFPRLHAVAAPVVVAGLIGLVVGALLLVACTPSSTSAPCGGANATCLPSGNCPFGPDGVVLLTAGLVALTVGIIGLWGRRPGEEPHPERPAARPPPDTALTRMEQEAHEHRESARLERDR